MTRNRHRPPPGAADFGRGRVGLRADVSGSIPVAVLAKARVLLGERLPEDAEVYVRLQPSQAPGGAPALDCPVSAGDLILEVAVDSNGPTEDALGQVAALFALPVSVARRHADARPLPTRRPRPAG